MLSADKPKFVAQSVSSDYYETVAREMEAISKDLLSYGADVNMCNSNGETALMIASRNRYTKIVDLIIEAGAQE